MSMISNCSVYPVPEEYDHDLLLRFLKASLFFLCLRFQPFLLRLVTIQSLIKTLSLITDKSAWLNCEIIFFKILFGVLLHENHLSLWKKHYSFQFISLNSILSFAFMHFILFSLKSVPTCLSNL